MLLNDEIFMTVIKSTPLVSIDLLITNELGNVLLGERLNQPAKKNWFVPGGRIRKNEHLDEAFERLMTEELGYACSRAHSRFLGVFEHFYQDSMFSDKQDGISTHYVVLAYTVPWNSPEKDHEWPLIQHARLRWWNIQDAMASDAVHSYSKAYFSYLK